MALRISDHCGNPERHEPHHNDTASGPYCDGEPDTLARQRERDANPPPGPPAPPRDFWSDYHEAHGRPDLSRRATAVAQAREEGRAEGLRANPSVVTRREWYEEGVAHGTEQCAALVAAVRELADEWDQPLPQGFLRDTYEGWVPIAKVRAVLDAADTTALDRHDAQVRAEALREAADILANAPWQRQPRGWWADWLRARADAQTSEGGGGG